MIANPSDHMCADSYMTIGATVATTAKISRTWETKMAMEAPSFSTLKSILA
jgi:hypothetical protein